MDRQLVKALIEALAASDLAELEYTSNGATLRLVKRHADPATSATRPAVPPSAQAPADPPPVPSSPAAEAAPPAMAPGIVAAPLYGVVHLQRTPGAAPFVTAGQPVAAGQVLCVIEAMKAFTEIRAERAGTLAAALVQSGDEVEAGHPLFRLD